METIVKTAERLWFTRRSEKVDKKKRTRRSKYQIFNSYTNYSIDYCRGVPSSPRKLMWGLHASTDTLWVGVGHPKDTVGV